MFAEYSGIFSLNSLLLYRRQRLEVNVVTGQERGPAPQTAEEGFGKLPWAGDDSWQITER
jgi:hypothetical protein